MLQRWKTSVQIGIHMRCDQLKTSLVMSTNRAKRAHAPKGCLWQRHLLKPQNRRTDKLSNVEVEWFVIPGYLVILR